MNHRGKVPSPAPQQSPALPDPSTFRHVQETEIAEAQQRDAKAAAQKMPQLCRLYQHVETAFDVAVRMTAMVQSSQQPDERAWASFARGVVTLQEADRHVFEPFRANRELIESMHRTPETFPLIAHARDTCVMLALDCAVVVESHLARTNGSSDFRKLDLARFDDLPFDDPSFGEWLGRFSDSIRASGLLPPPDQWSSADVWRDGSALIGRLQAERRAVTTTAGAQVNDELTLNGLVTPVKLADAPGIGRSDVAAKSLRRAKFPVVLSGNRYWAQDEDLRALFPKYRKHKEKSSD